MIAIRAIFDGKSFVPQQPVSLPEHSEALVIVEQSGGSQELDEAVRAYYTSIGGGDVEDDAWGNATSSQSHRAWDED